MWTSDTLLGIFSIAFAVVFLGYATGTETVLILLLLCIQGSVALRLWHGDLKLLAVTLLPAVLLQYMLPKALRKAVNALASSAR